MTDLQPENEAELVLAGHTPPGREDLAELASLMNEVRAFGSGPVPQPSAELAAILSGGTTDREPSVVPAVGVPAAPVDLAAARSRRGVGTRAALGGVAASVAAALAAGTMGVLPVAAQERFDRVVDMVQQIVGGSDVPADTAPVVDLEPRPGAGAGKRADDLDEPPERDRPGEDRATDRNGTKSDSGGKAGKQERERQDRAGAEDENGQGENEQRDRDRREKSDKEDDSDPKSDRDPRGDRDRDDDADDDRDDDGTEQEDADDDSDGSDDEDDNEAGVSAGSTKQSKGDDDGSQRRTAKAQSSDDDGDED